MSDEELRARHDALRFAAAKLLHYVANPVGETVRYLPEHHALHLALLAEEGEPAMPRGPHDGDADPLKHSLAFRVFASDGSSRPYELGALGRELSEELDGDRARKGERIPGHLPRNVKLTRARAFAIGSLLQELAERLEPGPAFGPGTEGEELARVARLVGSWYIDQASTV